MQYYVFCWQGCVYALDALRYTGRYGPRLFMRCDADDDDDDTDYICYCDKYFLYFLLPERDYVTFGSLLSQIRLSVTLVHPTQGVEPFGKISSPLCTLAIL